MATDDRNDRSLPPEPDELGRAKADHRLALAEAHHRTRNALGVVRSLIRRTVETSETLEDFTLHIEGRLDALARTENAIARNPGAGIGLDMLVADELLACQAREGEQVTLTGPAVRIGPKASLSLGLAFEELSTNAIKFGALSGKGGHVSVTWRLETSEGAPYLAITWKERGGPAIASAPTRTGFGTEMLERTLPYELHAEVALDYAPAGLMCTIRLPFTEKVFSRATLDGVKPAK